MSLHKLPTNRKAMQRASARLTPQLVKSIESEMQATGLGKAEIIRAALSDRYRKGENQNV